MSAFFIFFLTAAFVASPAQALPLLSLYPAHPVVSLGQAVEVDIKLDSVSNVFGIEVDLSFNPAILEVNEAKLIVGTCPTPDFVIENSANNAAGTIGYGVTQLSPTPPCDGGIVATISFSCVGDGTSDVSFTSNIISDPDGLPIPHGIEHGLVTCLVGESRPEITVKGGYIKLDTHNGSAPPVEHCNDIAHDGRMVVDSENGLIYICTQAGWIAK